MIGIRDDIGTSMGIHSLFPTSQKLLTQGLLVPPCTYSSAGSTLQLLSEDFSLLTVELTQRDWRSLSGWMCSVSLLTPWRGFHSRAAGKASPEQNQRWSVWNAGIRV